MRIKVLSDNKGIGIALRLKQSGHDVVLDGQENGLVPITTNGTSDLVLNLTQQKYDVVPPIRYLGQSRWGNAIESDSQYAIKIIDLLGWPSKPTFSGGSNLYITMWSNGDSIILSYASILYRRLMSGGTGPDIGGAGCLSLFNNVTDKLKETIVKPLENVLKRVSHQGVIHVHIVVNASSFYVKGISTQFYHPLTLAALENTNLAVANMLLKLLDVTSHPIRPLDAASAVLLVSAPPFPYNLNWPSVEVKGINNQSLKHLWLEDVAFDKGYKLGATGSLGYVTARGTNPQEACRRIYKTVSNISVPDMQYRNDIGRNINTLLESIKASGWIN